MEEEEGAVGMFQAITGADQATAQHVLEAHGWDLNKSVNFFMEAAGLPAARPVEEEGPHALPTEPPREVIDLEGSPEYEDAPAAGTSHRPQPRGSPLRPKARPQWIDDDDDELQAALNASLRTDEDDAQASDERPAPHTRQQNIRHEADDDFDDEDYVPVEGPAQQRTSRADVNSAFIGLPRGFLDADAGPRVRRNRPRGAAAPDLGLDSLAAAGIAAGFPPPFAEALAGPGPASLARAVPAAQPNGNGHADLPEGINLEEARMLEAAMLGIPYEGRIPEFRSRGPAEPVPPSVLHQRQLREEQDQAYHESLLADKRKADAAEEARRAELDEQRRQQQQEDAATQAQHEYERTISHKLASLPEEPPADSLDAVNVMVRTPGGGRFNRRFLRTNRLDDLFNFVDVSAAPDVKPGTYSLVTQFPRRIFEQGTAGSLADAGLTQKQEAIFLEPI